MRLTKYIDHKSTSLQVVVSYDEKDNEVLAVLSVLYADASGTTHDLTSLFAYQLNDEMEAILKRVDWREVYAETKAAA